MDDLACRHRSHVGRIKGDDHNRIAGERRELDLVALALLVHQHDGANVAGSKPLRGQITFQHDEVQLIDHRVTILLGTNVTKRGPASCNSTNHTTRTVGARRVRPAAGDAMRWNASPSSSWPGSSRPPTSSRAAKDVDARHKAGHDELDGIDEKTQAALSQIGREEKVAATDEVSPIVRHRASIAQLKAMGFAAAQPSLRAAKAIGEYLEAERKTVATDKIACSKSRLG
jgi:hypothetical protein